MKTALIAGSTGLVGKELLHQLLDSNQFSSVLALTRKTLSVHHSKLRNITVEFHRLPESPHDLRANHVFCCLGTTMAKAGSKEKFYEVDFRYPLALAETTFRLGAKHFFIVSALGADKNSGVYYNKVKGESEEAIKSIPFESIHIFRPSLLLGKREGSRPGEDIAKTLYKTLGFLVPRKYKAIEASKVARAMLLAALEDQKGIFIHESAEMQ